MEQKIKSLIAKYEQELKQSEENGYEECYDCCDITSKGEYETSLRTIIDDLKAIL